MGDGVLERRGKGEERVKGQCGSRAWRVKMADKTSPRGARRTFGGDYN
jgi:hypothetical protein